jgi:NADPH:quinone reductase-like Zn-dependent oxidoreductase
MKAIQLLEKNQEPQLVEVPIPEANEGSEVIRVSHAALNHRDLWIAKGMYAKIKYPVTPGSDLCGYLNNRRVLVNPGFNWGVSESVQHKSFEILGLPANGSFAEFVSVPKDYIYDVPEYLNDAQSAALPLAGITAYRVLFSKCNPQPNEKILITGIGGGVAVMVLQFALAFGLEVYVSSSDDNKIARAIALGAAGGVNYNNENWDQELISKIGGVDLIIDSAAGKSFNKLINVCNPGARISIYGGTQGLITDISPQTLFWKQISIFGSVMGTQIEFKKMLTFIESKKIVPVIDSIFELSQAGEALERMQFKKQFGKIILKVS